MTEVDKLKEQLRKAEDDEKRQKIEQQLKEMKDQYEDKCFCTHTFQKKRPNMNFRMIWIKSVTISKDDNQTIKFETENISYSRDAKRMTKFDFTESQFTDPTQNYHGFRHEVPKEVFLSVKTQVHGNLDSLFDTIRNNMQQDVYVTVGDDGDEKSAFNLLERSGAKYVDTTQYSGDGFSRNITEILRWNKHPMMVGKYMIISPASKQMTKDIISDLQNNARHWGCSVYDRDMPRAQALTRFLEAVKWE